MTERIVPEVGDPACIQTGVRFDLFGKPTSLEAGPHKFAPVWMNRFIPMMNLFFDEAMLLFYLLFFSAQLLLVLTELTRLLLFLLLVRSWHM